MTAHADQPESTTLRHVLVALVLLCVPASSFLVWPTAVASPLVQRAQPFACVSWDPNHAATFEPSEPVEVSDEDMAADLKVLAPASPCVRTYRSTFGLGHAPKIAGELGLDVILGARLTPASAFENERELDNVTRIARESENVKLVVIGNETQLRLAPDDDVLDLEILRAHLRAARAQIEQPVTTAEPWDFWLAHPEVVEDVDVIGVHAIPYWSGVAREDAVAWVLARRAELQRLHPTKPVVILETGWPSRGPVRGAARPGVAEQAAFLSELSDSRLGTDGLINIVEGFDQPWKIRTWEGRVGTSWGLFDAARRPKLSFIAADTEPASSLPWAVGCALITLPFVVVLARPRTACGFPGALLGVALVQLVGFAFVLAVRATVVEYRADSVGTWALVATTALLTAVVAGRILQAALVVGRAPLRRRVAAPPVPGARLPAVSIHLPCRNEPPDVVIATIERLLALDYPDFEVLVVDNNTTDEARWRPLEAFCAGAGPRVRFFHVDELPGNKAGALNYALDRADPRCELMAVVDSDYLVERDWLLRTVPHFTNPRVAAVQAPQAYRAFEADPFQTRARDEYVGFFRIGMVQRNEANAIIQHGTMVVLRRSVVEEVGRWAEWCIVEDSELGLRMLARGHEILYVDAELGAGLVPPTFAAYARQRQRWVYGAVRTMRAHWRTLLGLEAGLTWRQRYHFLDGWMPWIATSLHPLISVTCLYVAWHAIRSAPSLPALEYPGALLLFAAVEALLVVVTYRARVRVGWRRTLGTLVIGAALTPTISLAVFRAMVGRPLPFRVTEKGASSTLTARPRRTRWIAANATLAVVLVGAAVVLVGTLGLNVDTATWSLVLLIQAGPAACAAWFEARH